jgi:Cu/Zn superoxide dismutase
MISFHAWVKVLIVGVGCGSAFSSALPLAQTRPRAAVSTVGMYPDYAGSIMAMGTVAVQNTESGIKLIGTLTGLETMTMGGIHIHTGITCDDASLVGGHYYGGASVDPWLTTSYMTNAMGVASVELSLDDFSLGGDYPVAGRALVVHAANGDRIGCGVLMSTAGEVVSLGVYPGYMGMYENTTTGTVIVTNTDDRASVGVSIMGTLAGLEMGKTGGFHVHSGT